MILISVEVENQKISINKIYSIRETEGYIKCEFKFATDDWSGTVKTAYFKNACTKAITAQLLENDACFIPSEALTAAGYIEFSVAGEKANYRITSAIAEFYNGDTIYGGEPSDPTPSQYDQIIAQTAAAQTAAENAEKIADEIQEKAESGAFNGKDGAPGPAGPQGEPGAAATIEIGETTTGEPGTQASVTNTGTETAAVLNFTIPKGEDYLQIRTPISLAEHSSRTNPLNVFSLADGVYEVTEEGWIGNGESSKATAKMLKGSIFIKLGNSVNIITESCYYIKSTDEKWNDLYLPTYAEVETITQNALGKITPSTSTSLSLKNAYEYRYAEPITELNLSITSNEEDNEKFTAALIFKSGTTAPTISYSSDDFKFTGDDCDSAGDFIPQPNTGYEISFKQLGYGYVVARVGAF